MKINIKIVTMNKQQFIYIVKKDKQYLKYVRKETEKHTLLRGHLENVKTN